jgi:hypothetical protein
MKCRDLRSYKNGIKTEVAETYFLIRSDYMLHCRTAIYGRINMERFSEVVVATTLPLN